MAQKTSGFHKIFSIPIFYFLTQKIMSGESKRAALVKNEIKKGFKVLDVGCGTAKILEYLPKIEYYGYDISKRFIDYAKQKYKSKKIYLYCKRINKYEIKRIPKCDCVILFGLMHHLNDSELSEILFIVKKILKKNGTLLTCDPVLIKNQNIIAKFLIKNDVGKNVRNDLDYLKILKKYFKKIKINIDKQNFIPYTWFSTKCHK